jgi:hypothetical protein
MNIDDIELKLLLGLPIEVDGLGQICSPKVRDVAKVGESTYNEYLGTLLFSKENVNKEFSGDFSDYQLFCILYAQVESFREMVNLSFNFFMHSETHLDTESAFFYLVNGDSVGRLTEENFYLMQDHIRLANFIKKNEKEEEKYNPADKETAALIKELLEFRRNNPKPKPKPTIDLRSIISGMSWKCPSVDISEKTIFQLYDGYRRLQNLDSLHYAMYGIYTGNVDVKKLNMNELNFALILKD